MRCRLCHHHTRNYINAPETHGRRLINRSNNYQYNICPHCNSLTLDLSPDDNFYRQAYDKNYYPTLNFSIKILNFISFSLKELIIINYFNKKQISLLDVGCGDGLFLESLNHRFHTHGIDFHKPKISHRHRLFRGNIEHFKFPYTFDCLTLWHSLEHLPQPHKTLKRLFSLLNPDGRIFITTPSATSLGCTLGRQHYFHLDPPRHLSIPSSDGLAIALSESGFTDIKFHPTFYEYPLDLFWSLRSSPLKYFIYPLYPFFKLLNRQTIFVSAKKPPKPTSKNPSHKNGNRGTF